MKPSIIQLSAEPPKRTREAAEASKLLFFAKQGIRDAWNAAKATARPANVSETELILYGEIGYDWWTDSGITAETVADFIAGLPNGTSEITVRINSPGGDVFEGIAIYNALLNSGLKVHVKIDALAASIATVIAMAGDTVSMAGNGQFMVHKAWTLSIGNADDMRACAALLESIDSGSIISTYAARTGMSEGDLSPMLAAETWMDAKTAKEKGFIDTVEALKSKPEPTPEPAPDNRASEQETETLRQWNTLRKMQAALAA